MSHSREQFARELGPGGLEARGYVFEVRADSDEGPVITGIGSPYDQAARIEGWFESWDEVVAPGAWRNTITRDGADIISTFNHNVDNLLGRTSAGTLELSESDDGLVYTVQVNQDDPQAMGVHARVARQDVSGSSVWFRVTREEWEEPSDDNGLEVPRRTILDAELFEVGPVTFPAFEQTTSQARAAGFKDLGVSQASLQVLDGALTAAGVAQKRAAYSSRFLADPSNAEADIRALFARSPNLKEKVCDVDRAAAAAAGAPQPQVADQKTVERMRRQLDALTVKSAYLLRSTK